MAGSPPHTRGKGNCFKTRIITLRITPAHAGKSKLSVFLVIFFPGSPPHTRGKAVERIGAVVRAGITPAHAGKRGTAGRCISPLPDHPRTRGEKSQIIGKNSAKSGSPPHTRGKACALISVLLDIRITPAHAGKSRCGYLPVLPKPGSPPHTRGKVVEAVNWFNQLRITPAHAGKSFYEYSRAIGGEDHPRTRGEKGAYRRFRVLVRGSPPHTRGKDSTKIINRTGSRITPAHAGKRLFLITCQCFIAGSPPHTRGKAEYRFQTVRTHRITPAHAGKRPLSSAETFSMRDHPRTRGEKTKKSR